jgi:hypothetical protein
MQWQCNYIKTQNFVCSSPAISILSYLLIPEIIGFTSEILSNEPIFEIKNRKNRPSIEWQITALLEVSFHLLEKLKSFDFPFSK